MRLSPCLVLAFAITACRASPTPPDPARLDPVARRYVALVLALGAHDPNYVDSYYGPDSIRSSR